MRRTDRQSFVVPIGIGVGHCILVSGLLLWLGYPREWFVGTAAFRSLVLVLGLFLVGFIPVVLVFRGRLVVPLGMSIAGCVTAIVAGLTTPHPEFAPLGKDVLVVGPSYLGAYANGWYVWLLAYGLGGACEYVGRTSDASRLDPVKVRDWHIPPDRRTSLFFGCASGAAHTIVIITLGIGHGTVVLSGWLLGWGLFSAFLLGSAPMVSLIRYQLRAPLAVLVAIQLILGVETLVTTGNTPVSSYLLFWPVYFVVLLLSGVGEFGLRWSYRKVTDDE